MNRLLGNCSAGLIVNWTGRVPEGWLPGVNLPGLRLYLYRCLVVIITYCSSAEGVRLELVPNSCRLIVHGVDIVQCLGANRKV